MIKLKTIFITAVAVMISSQAIARDQIKIVGSSTVYPYTTVVAERFGKQGKFKTPVVESTGTGGGFKSFCGGVGVQHPDMTGASRAIKKDEMELERMAEIINYISGKLMDDGNSPELIAGVLAACSLSIYRSVLNDEEYESMIDEISKCRGRSYQRKLVLHNQVRKIQHQDGRISDN